MKIQQTDDPLQYIKKQPSEDQNHVESSEEVYHPKQGQKNKKSKNRGNKNTKKGQFNSSLWTLRENIAYKEFLQANFDLFEKDREGRKIIKINVLMSKAVMTRSPDQCRSHHQKMMKYHSSIGQIIEHINDLSKAKEPVEENEALVKTQEPFVKAQNNQAQYKFVDFNQQSEIIKNEDSRQAYKQIFPS